MPKHVPPQEERKANNQDEPLLTPDEISGIVLMCLILMLTALGVSGGIFLGLSAKVHSFDEAAKASWERASCTVESKKFSTLKCGSGGRAANYYQVSFGVVLSSPVVTAGTDGVALKYPSWTEDCGTKTGECSEGTYCWGRDSKREAKEYMKGKVVGGSYACYYDPNDWSDIAFDLESPKEGQFVAGVWLLSGAGATLLFLCALGFRMMMSDESSTEAGDKIYQPDASPLDGFASNNHSEL